MNDTRIDADDIVEKIVQSQNFADINNTEGTVGIRDGTSIDFIDIPMALLILLVDSSRFSVSHFLVSC